MRSSAADGLPRFCFESDRRLASEAFFGSVFDYEGLFFAGERFYDAHEKNPGDPGF